jgi:hypothetical protein
MKIRVERSGGFTGITKTLTLETEDLPKDINGIIERCFSEVIPSDTPTRSIRGKGSSPDTYSYKITNQGDKKKKEIEFNELNGDKHLRLAMNYLFKKYGKVS